MIDFINGIIEEINSDSVIISTNGIGFKIYTPNPYVFKEGETCKVYLYNHIREDEYSLYGFKQKEEKELFLKLLSVKGLGPKVGLTILATGSIEGIIDAIDRENILYIKKFPKVGEKLARQIILDLKGKLITKGENNTVINEELVQVLESLGYKKSDINKIIKNVNTTLPIEDQIKEALKLLIK
jgi:Holliday junction DNA helicase RuvA